MRTDEYVVGWCRIQESKDRCPGVVGLRREEEHVGAWRETEERLELAVPAWCNPQLIQTRQSKPTQVLASGGQIPVVAGVVLDAPDPRRSASSSSRASNLPVMTVKSLVGVCPVSRVWLASVRKSNLTDTSMPTASRSSHESLLRAHSRSCSGAKATVKRWMDHVVPTRFKPTTRHQTDSWLPFGLPFANGVNSASLKRVQRFGGGASSSLGCLWVRRGQLVCVRW